MRTRKKFSEIDWSKRSLVHNAFRVYEYIFGRKHGIRCENATIVTVDDDTGEAHVVREFYTAEAVLAYWEASLYEFLKAPFKELAKIPKIRVYAPAFSNYVPAQPFGYVFAVAVDASTAENVHSAASPDTTVAHTTSGSDRALLFGFNYGGGGTLSNASSITYNSAALTSEVTNTNNARWCSLWSLIAPDTGSNTAVVTWSGTKNEKSYLINTFTGVDQTDMVDVTNTASISGTSFSVSLTTLVDDAWVVGAGVARNNRTWSVSTDTTALAAVPASVSPFGVICHTAYNPGGTAGSFSVNWTCTGGSETGPMVAVSLVPAPAAAGSNIGSIYGVSKANIKSVLGKVLS